MRRLCLKSVLLFLVFFCLPLGAAAAKNGADTKPNKNSSVIAVVTPKSSGPLDSFWAAEYLGDTYGRLENGGMICHVTLDDKVAGDKNKTAQTIASFASLAYVFPLNLKAVIVSPALPGTAEGFKKIAASRPDLILIAVESVEDVETVAEYATLVINTDNLRRPYALVHTAKQMGADALIHLAFESDLKDKKNSDRLILMQTAARVLGVKLVSEVLPDSVSKKNEAELYIAERFDGWLGRYGQDTAFFSANKRFDSTLMRLIMNSGGIFPEEASPNLLAAYPEILGLNVSNDVKTKKISLLKLIESKIVENNAGERMGTWLYADQFSYTLGAAELARRHILKKNNRDILAELLKSFEDITPRALWGLHYYRGPDGRPNYKIITVYQDTYVFGKGYMDSVALEPPDSIMTYYDDPSLVDQPVEGWH